MDLKQLIEAMLGELGYTNYQVSFLMGIDGVAISINKYMMGVYCRNEYFTTVYGDLGTLNDPEFQNRLGRIVNYLATHK